MVKHYGVFVLTKEDREVEVKLDSQFEYVLIVNDNDELLLKVDVDTITVGMLADLFDPGTIETIREYVGF